MVERRSVGIPGGYGQPFRAPLNMLIAFLYRLGGWIHKYELGPDGEAAKVLSLS